jgi:hypothetical protein
MIRIADVRGLRTPEQRAGVCYVGRRFAGWPGHPLGNPFRPGQSLTACLDRYRSWLLGRPTLEADLARLWKECEHGAKPLGCWCTTDEVCPGVDPGPLVCHAQILAVEIVKRKGA